MSDYHESSEESEDIQEIRDSLALLENLFVCDGDFKGGSERNGSDDGFWDNSDSESDSEFQGSLDSEEGKSWKTSITWSPSAMDD